MASGPRWNLASYRERLTQDTVKPTTVAQREEEFKRNGYTVFRGFNAAWIERWRPVFMDHYRRQLGQDQRGSGVGQARAVLRGLLQEYPDLFLPSLVAPEMLDFLGGADGSHRGFRQPADRHHAAGRQARGARRARLAPRYVGADGVDGRLPAAERRERTHLPAGRSGVRPVARDPRLAPRQPRGRRGRCGARPGRPAGGAGEGPATPW